MANNNHFDLTLDTLAPSGSITRPGQYLKQNANLLINAGDATFMKVWFNSNASGSTSDPEYPVNPEAAAATKSTAFVNPGNYYYHMTLIDDVNNESQVYDTAIMIFDTNAPTVSNAYMADPDTGSRTITNDLNGVVYSFDYSDGAGAGSSGAISFEITGTDINTISSSLDPTLTTKTGTLDFKPDTDDGLKTIYITVTDRAGNVTSPAVEVNITLDTQLDAPVLVLQDSSGAQLPSYINFREIYINITDADTLIDGYKIWEEGETEPAYTEVTPGSGLDLTVTKTLSSGDGLKTIHAKVKDTAGSEASAVDVSVTVDSTAPANVHVTSDVNMISDIAGHNTATLTLTGSDNLGLASYTLECGSTVIDSDTATASHIVVVPATFSLTSANSMQEGQNTITITLTDKAGNVSTDSCVVILDTTAPTASIASLNTWYNAQFPISVTLADAGAYASGVHWVYAWVNNSPSDTSVPSGYAGISATAGINPITATNISWVGVQQSNANYMHVKVVDAVGNANFDHEQFGFDNVEPAQPSVVFTAGAYPSQNAETMINFSADVSGVTVYRITGDITDATPAGTWENLPTPVDNKYYRAVTLTSGDGYKYVQIQVKDAAGNESILSQAAQCELDTTDPSVTLSLFEADNTTSKPAVSPVETFVVRIAAIDEAVSPDVDPDPSLEYKIWGDFTVGSQQASGTDEPSTWTPYVKDFGQNYMSITNLYCTSTDGLKNIRVQVKDSAGRVSSVTVTSFTYDTAVPTVSVSGVDYNIISKVHIERRDSTGIIDDKYADECNFTFTPNEVITEYKVCAYADQAAAIAGDHNDPAIPTTAGSNNMSGITNSANPVGCLIKGADYETALGGTGHDGAHIVVVYVKDRAGQWSVAADFTTSL